MTYEDKYHMLEEYYKVLQSDYLILQMDNKALKKEVETLKKKLQKKSNQSKYQMTVEDIDDIEIPYDIYKKIYDDEFKVYSKIPPFGYVVPEKDEPDIIKNAVFGEHIIDDNNPENNKVILWVVDKDGTDHNVAISESYYRQILLSTAKYEAQMKAFCNDSTLANASTVMHDKALNLDYHKYRLNTAEDFWHNFRVQCERNAETYQDALDCASWIIKTMTKKEKKLMKKSIRKEGKRVWHTSLLAIFEAVQKCRTDDR